MTEAREQALRNIMARGGVDRDEAEEILDVAIRLTKETYREVPWDEAIDVWVRNQPPLPDHVHPEDWKLLKNVKISQGDIVYVTHDEDGSVDVLVTFRNLKKEN